MSSVGEILKKSRESKKLELSEVSKELMISDEIIFNLEHDIKNDHINFVFLLGHLRSYCNFLELNDEELINQFKKENLKISSENIEIQRPKLENNFFLLSNKIFSATLILFIITTFYFLFIQNDNPSREYAIIPDIPENFQAVVEKSNLDNIIQNTSNENVDSFDLKDNINLSSAIASTPNVEDKRKHIVTLKILDDTWMQLRDKNDNIILSKLMNKNEEYSYDLDSNYSITSGNAGHILVLIDQNVRGKVGNKGQVVDSLILDINFNK